MFVPGLFYNTSIKHLFEQRFSGHTHTLTTRGSRNHRGHRTYRIPKGLWLPRQNVISIQRGLSDVQAKCTLAHAVHGHTGACGTNNREESQADRWAAQTLISHIEYASAEAIYGQDIFMIAEELSETIHLVEIWQKLFSFHPTIPKMPKTG